MKKHLIIIPMLLVTTLMMQAQELDQHIIDKKNGREILIGNVTCHGLEKSGDWYDIGYKQYSPDSVSIDRLSKYAEDFPDIFIVLGTWCGDSREQLPHFFKILDQLDYPAEKVSMIAVDRDKKAGNYDAANDDIQRVPTFVFTLHGKEIGRIIESPIHSLEHDFLKILSNSTSLPHD